MSETVFSNGPIFIGDGKVIDSGAVVVKDGRIAEVIAGPYDAPAGAESIDLGGKMILPGLIDCHIHITMDGSPDPMTKTITMPKADLTLMSADLAKKTVFGGVTTVRDMGSEGTVDLAIRKAVTSGLVVGPRLLASAQVVCMTGGHGWQFGREADGPDQVRKAAREQLKAGADQVKLMATGGVMTPGVEPGAAQLTEDELRAGIEEAHKTGRLTATHAQGSDGIMNAVRAGIDSIEHGFFLTDEIIELMIKKGTSLVPTLSAIHFIVKHGVEAGVPEFMVEKARRVQEPHIESMMKAKGAGVRIGMGTDAGTPFNEHGKNLRELDLMVRAGFNPTEVLVAASKTAAEVIGLADEIGTIEPGKEADLIVCKGDPTKNITLLTDADNIALVYRNGCKVK